MVTKQDLEQIQTHGGNIDNTYNLTGRSMPFFNSNLFTTITFANSLYPSCEQCREVYWEFGYPEHVKHTTRHSHPPSYTQILAVGSDLSRFFSPTLSRFVVEGSPNFIKKIDSYLDEHKLRGLFSSKDNSRVTRPHIHGIIKYLNIMHFKTVLARSNYYARYLTNTCCCYSRDVIKDGSNNWRFIQKRTYKNCRDTPLKTVNPREHHTSCTSTKLLPKSNEDSPCIIPDGVLKPRGFFDVQPIKDDLSVIKYLEKYLQKDGCDGRIF
jgi:hypothetical protein